MASLIIAWRYLTSYAVATDPTSRDRAEWPPHPARVFMALTAAWAETEPREDDEWDRQEWTAEREALLWLETLCDPEMLLPTVKDDAERSNVLFYVPVNDKAGPSRATLQSCPALTRSKQARTFPKRWVGDLSSFLIWPKANETEIHREALERLCRKVTRLGHSSSLVSMHLADEAELPVSDSWTRFVPDRLHANRRVRSLVPGTLDMLEQNFGDVPRRRHAGLSQKMEDLKQKKQSLSGKGVKEAKGAIDQQIQAIHHELSTIVARPAVRPTIGLWTGYREQDGGGGSPNVVQTLFDPDILVMTRIDGPQLPVVSTLTVLRILRKTILSECTQPVPGWVSGHEPDGQPLRDGSQHMALIPLPFVGSHPHADGHLLGVGLVFPRSVERRDRGRVLGPLLVDEKSRSPKCVTLKLGSLGEWQIQKRDWEERRAALDPDQWTAASTIWASVTPVVLDRFPKNDRNRPEQREAWEQEVDEMIRAACKRIGLPEPELVDIGTTSWHRGSPRAIAKRRPLREQDKSEGHVDASLGDGFPPYPAKGTNASRPQVHAWLRFARPVVGPILLGAGRFLGYGLFKPWSENRA